MEWIKIKGYLGEFLSRLFLNIKGYQVLAQRYKTSCGEIDIIAQKGNTVVFIEVKARKDQEKCFVAITDKQLKRVQNASQIFLKNHPKLQNCDIRYDVMLVADWRIPLHIENITM